LKRYTKARRTQGRDITTSRYERNPYKVGEKLSIIVTKITPNVISNNGHHRSNQDSFDKLIANPPPKS
jgi:hypothetical protein